MNPVFVSCGVLVVIAGGLAGAGRAADPATAPPAGAIDDAARKRID